VLFTKSTKKSPKSGLTKALIDTTLSTGFVRNPSLSTKQIRGGVFYEQPVVVSPFGSSCRLSSEHKNSTAQRSHGCFQAYRRVSA
jgi:hypothetical protein